MWQRKRDGERISTDTHTFPRGLWSIKQKCQRKAASASLLYERAGKRKKKILVLTFHVNTQKCKRGVEKIFSSWQTDMLRRKILLSGSAAKTFLQPNVIRCQKSLKHYSARGTHQAERLVLLLLQKYYPARTNDPFSVWLGDDGIHMGPIIFFLSIVDYLYRKTLPKHTCTFLAKKVMKSCTYTNLHQEAAKHNQSLEWWEFEVLPKGIVIVSGEPLIYSFKTHLSSWLNNNFKLDSLNLRTPLKRELIGTNLIPISKC